MELEALIEGFGKVAIASVADAVDKVCGHRGYLDHLIKPQINDQRICGPAATVLEVATDEFLPPQHALDLIDEAPRGSVIVISIMLPRARCRRLGRIDDCRRRGQRTCRCRPRWWRA